LHEQKKDFTIYDYLRFMSLCSACLEMVLYRYLFIRGITTFLSVIVPVMDIVHIAQKYWYNNLYDMMI